MENTDDISAIEKQLVAMNESIDDIREQSNKKVKEARVASLKAAMEFMTESERDSLRASIKKSDDEEAKEALKAVDRSYDKDLNPKPRPEETHGVDIGNSKATRESERLRTLGAKYQALTAKLETYEMKEKEKLVNELVGLKAGLIKGVDEDSLRDQWMKRPFEIVQQMYDDRTDEIGALKAAATAPQRMKSFGFAASTKPAKLVDFDEIIDQAGVM